MTCSVQRSELKADLHLSAHAKRTSDIWSTHAQFENLCLLQTKLVRLGVEVKSPAMAGDRSESYYHFQYGVYLLLSYAIL